MAEIKRNFSAPGIDRDLDDRLLPAGKYRDALNVNVGRSEGGDVGALENLKGNMLITGQDAITGTTIGTVRDPNNDRIYWFTKGDNIDAIYEYDETTGAVSTILSDSVPRDNVKPTCAPEFRSFINEPDSDGNTRPPLPDLPDPPRGTCMLATGPNGRPNTNFDPSGDFEDNSICIEEAAPPPPPQPGQPPVAQITGPVVGLVGQDVTLSGLTSAPGTAQGGAPATIAIYQWTGPGTDNGDGTFTVNRPAAGSVSVTLVVTNSDGLDSTNFAIHSVAFSNTPVTVLSFTGTTTDSVANATSSGGIANLQRAETGFSFIDYDSMIVPDAGFQWLTLPVATTTGLPAGVNQGVVMGLIGSTNAANVNILGVWTGATGDITANTEWTGGSVEAIPAAAQPVSYNIAAASWSLTSVPGPNTQNRFSRQGTDANIFVSITQTDNFAVISGFGFTVSVDFTATPTAVSGGNTVQMVTQTISPFPNDPSHDFRFMWTVDPTIDTTWTITVTDVTISDPGGTVVGSTGNIIGGTSPLLTRG